MADTGAPWNIPYVEPADLVRNYPAANELMADAIAAGLSAAGTDAIERTGTDSTVVQVGDSGVVSVSDGTQVRPLTRAVETGVLAAAGVDSSGRLDTITFVANRFTTAPVISTGILSTINNNDLGGLGLAILSVTDTSFSLRRRQNAGTTDRVYGAHWHAIEV